MRLKRSLWVFVGSLVLGGWCLSTAAGMRQVHHFRGSVARAKSPEYTKLVEYSGRYYGVTSRGGPYPENVDDSYGIVFSIKTDGTGFRVLHEFRGATSDGENPCGSLVIDPSRYRIYGMTAFGGAYDKGTIFRMYLDGSGYSLLRSLDDADGIHPYGSLVLSGSYLYGMGCDGGGGADDLGTLFRIGTDGSGFTVLHDFAGGIGDGAHPYGSLTLSGSTLYGMTSAGGTAGTGTLFSFRTDTFVFTPLHDFTGTAGDGATPYGNVLLSGSTLYGMTYAGGTGQGILFSITTGGLSFTVLHTFAGGTTGGANPYGSLALSGTTLYGTTSAGGTNSLGTVFSFPLSGGTLTLLHSFSGYNADPALADGSLPKGTLLLASNGRLVGMTREGGPFNNTGGDLLGFGTLFSLLPGGTDYRMVTGFGYGPDASKPMYQTPVLYGSRIYGMTQFGGYYDRGALFSVYTSGYGFSTLHEFGGTGDGAEPYGDPLLYNGVIYGVTYLGGANNDGTIFKVNRDGTGYTILRSLDDADGINPAGALATDGSVLYGTASAGGTYGYGTVFKIGMDGSGFAVLHDFDGVHDGRYPYARLLLSGSTLYGTCTDGGDEGGGLGTALGTLFSCTTTGTFNVLHTFLGGLYDGAAPWGGVVLGGTTLYGFTDAGGIDDGYLGYGTVYKFEAGAGFSLLYTFQGNLDPEHPDGAHAPGTPILVSGTLYGLTSSGGTDGLSDLGTLFAISTSGSPYNLLYGFLGYPTDGRLPLAGLAYSNGTFYGMANQGGYRDMGTLFAFTAGEDEDGDGVPSGIDCNDDDGTVWYIPTEPLDLEITGTAPTTVSWTACEDPGGDQTIYYDLLRSSSAGDWSAATCLESNITDYSGEDAAVPDPGVCFYYLPRAENTCGGNMGYASDGTPRTGVACP